MTRWSLPFALALLAACDGGKDGSNDTGDTSDTGPVEDTYADGCITVDGAGGYALIADALTVADEGSTIQLCAGTYNEAIAVTKAVTLIGAEGVIVEAPANEVPLTVTAGATVSNLVLRSTRAGVRIEDAAAPTLENITVETAASWGVSIATSTDVTLRGITLVEPEGGGMEVRGSSVDLEGGSLAMPVGFAFDLKNSDVRIADTVVDGVVMLTDDVTDGIGVMLDGGSLVLEGVEFLNVPGIGVQGDGSSITARATTFTAPGYLAIFAFGTDLDAEDLTITDPLLQGIYVEGSAARLVRTSITTTPEASCDLAYADWGTNGNPWCGGLLVASDTIDMEDVSISGFNNYGALLQPSNEALAALNWTGGTVSNVGRWGTRILNATGSIDGVTVTGTREPELDDPCNVGDIILVSSAMLTAGSADLALTELDLSDNAGFGIMAVQGTHAVSGSTFARNQCSGIFEFQGATTVDASTFEANGLAAGQWGGGVCAYESVVTATGNTFTGAHANSEFSYSDGTNTYRYVYSGYGRDILGYTAANLVVQGNTFSDGDGSIEVQGGRASVTDNTWSGYDGTLFYSLQRYVRDTDYDGYPDVIVGEASRPHVFSRNSADDIGGAIAVVAYGALEVEDVEVGTTRARTVSYAGYTNDVPDYEYSYESSSPAFQASGDNLDYGTGETFDLQASLTMTNVSIEEATAQAISTTDAVVTLSDVSVTRAGTSGQDAIYAAWSSFPVQFEAGAVVVAESGGTGINLYNTRAEDGYASLDVTSIGNTAGAGIEARGVPNLAIVDAQVTGTGGYAVDVNQLVSYYDYDLSTSVTAMLPGNVTVEGLVVEGGGGVSVVGAPLDLRASELGTVLDGTSLVSGCVSAQGASAVTLTEVGCRTTATAGVSVDEDTSYTSTEGALVAIDADTVTTLTGVRVAGATTAVSVDGGTFVATDLEADGTCTDGVRLSDTTSTFSGNTLSNLAGYGMVCEPDVTFDACGTNDLSGNALGAVNGCPESCGL